MCAIARDVFINVPNYVTIERKCFFCNFSFDILFHSEVKKKNTVNILHVIKYCYCYI